MAKDFTPASFLSRWVFSLALVLGTYNPTSYCYFNWIAENENGMPEFKRMMQADLEHPIEKVGKDLRGRMDWLTE